MSLCGARASRQRRELTQDRVERRCVSRARVANQITKNEETRIITTFFCWVFVAHFFVSGLLASFSHFLYSQTIHVHLQVHVHVCLSMYRGHVHFLPVCMDFLSVHWNVNVSNCICSVSAWRTHRYFVDRLPESHVIPSWHMFRSVFVIFLHLKRVETFCKFT